ncbi:MAG: DUF58 domain-containing protein [Devosia sp.]|uniref:DUF58 domain-containing protein n=1 Tax=Devosia sp. TaxID=1871048 RepID=UPI0019F1E874|nr:DUF58 domain-containing protein [Devosia sp.]MBF0678815.1 DUF58 domain-containing protein [Devosia sp.]
MRPPAPLLERLSRSRMLPASAQPSVGMGERLSRQKGAGMEFLDFRPYQAGDDTRNLDPYLYARTGEFVVREYARSQQLPVTIALDLSASMASGDNGKFERAKLISQLFGFIALASGDRVQLAVTADHKTLLSPRWHGAARADYMFDWIDKRTAGEEGGFIDMLRALPQHLPPRGLVIAVSDWWDDDVGPALNMLRARDQEVVAIQVLGPNEIDPSSMDQGIVTLEDVETGQEIELSIDAQLLDQYRSLFAARQDELHGLFTAKHWHFLTVSTQDDLDQLFTHTLRAKGVLS